MYTTELITRLHVNAVVLPEWDLWIQTINNLSAKYRTAWSFYKLLEPTESLTSLRRFRTLGCASISWKKVNSDQIGQQTVRQLQGVRVNPRFEKLASMPLPPEFCGANAQSQIDLLYSITHSQHINIRWQGIADAIANDEFNKW